MKPKYNVKWLWTMVCLMVLGLFPSLWAQETNGLPFENGSPSFDLSAFPRGKEAIWFALIPPVTFTITWMVGKIPPLPKQILPWITPVVGVLLGSVFEWAINADWAWWSTAGAGAVAVAIYEAAKGLTQATPVSTLTPTKPQRKG